jgi:dipeptidyl aminopeptidase/acylaminoacyl peptidase
MLGCFLIAAVPQAGANELLPRRRLFPDFNGQVFRGSVQVSPEGDRLCYIVLAASGTGLKEASVATRSVGKSDERCYDSSKANTPIRSLQWAFSGRYVLYERQRSASPGTDVYCLDVSTGKVTRLLPEVKASSTIAALSPRAPDEIILAADGHAAGSPDLYRVDLRSGESRVVFHNPGFQRLLLDDSFEARIGIKVRDDGHAEVIAIIPKGENRTLLSADALLTPLSNHAQLVGFGKTGRDAYVLSNYHRDTIGLINCDLETGTLKLVFEAKYADVANVLFDSNRGCVLACSYEYDRTRWSAIEPSMQPHLTYLQSLEDGNLSVRSRSVTGEIWIASYAMLDTSTRYYAYDARKKAARFLFASGSAFDGLPLAKMHSVVINSRDKLPLTGYLTLPRGIKMKDETHPAAAAPMVLLVHGGPYGRDEWGFHGEHQLLANRGYAVLGVNFRGSEGFGRHFLEAADREWGGKVVDDVADAADWAIQEGIADPKRTALMGSSFGGYAALMSLARYPDKFCCAIDRAGPCDLEWFVKEIAAQSPAYAATRIGDPTTKIGLQQLRDWSPIRQVNRLNRPILVFQGGRESKVQQEEKISLVRQLRDRKVAATYVEFPQEAHSFQRRDTRLAYYAIIESFLAGHLGGNFEPFQDDVARPVVGECVGESEIAGLDQALTQPQ